VNVITLPQIQDLALHLGELHEISLSLILQPVQVPVNGSTTSWCTRHPSQFCIICEAAEDALHFSIQDEEVKQYWPQYPPLWSPLVTYLQTDFVPLVTTLQAWQKAIRLGKHDFLSANPC